MFNSIEVILGDDDSCVSSTGKPTSCDQNTLASEGNYRGYFYKPPVREDEGFDSNNNIEAFHYFYIMILHFGMR